MHVAIIGAGASGTLLALQLLRQPSRPHVTLIGRAGFARGVAYGTDNAVHLLNVPAGKMSAFPDQPDHFLAWAQKHGAAEPGDFLPRRLYGAYLQDLLRNAQSQAGAQLRLIDSEAVAATSQTDSIRLTLANGDTLQADRAVLALGNHKPAVPGGLNPDLLITDPWAPGALHGIGAEDSVLLIGTGLTMVDVVLSLTQAGHRGPIHAVSRRGLLPHAHRAVAEAPPLPSSLPATLPALLHLLRQQAAQAQQAGSDWRAVLDRLRPHTQDLWQRADDVDRQRFLRHARRMWDIHRHRMAPSVAHRIQTMRDAGQLHVQAGHIAELAQDGAALRAVVAGRHGTAVLRPAYAINCAGPGDDYANLNDKLVQHLLRDGLVRPDPLRLSLDVQTDCAMLNRHGAPSPALFAIGPVTRGQFWEITAMPDIRAQAAQLAKRLTA